MYVYVPARICVPRMCAGGSGGQKMVVVRYQVVLGTEPGSSARAVSYPPPHRQLRDRASLVIVVRDHRICLPFSVSLFQSQRLCHVPKLSVRWGYVCPV